MGIMQALSGVWQTVLAYWETLKDLIEAMPLCAVAIVVVLAVAIVYLVAGR